MNNTNNTTPLSRIKVTFSEDDNTHIAITQTATLEAKLKASILQRFHHIHEEYSVENLPAVVSTLLKAHGVIQSRKKMWVLSPSGVWEQSTMSFVLKLAIDTLAHDNYDQYQRYRLKIEQALHHANATATLATRTAVLDYLDSVRDDLHSHTLEIAKSHKFEATIFPQAIKLINDDQFEMLRDTDCDAVAANCQLYTIQPVTNGSSGALSLQVKSRDDMKRYRITKCLPIAMPATGSDIAPRLFSNVQPQLVSHVRALLGNALLANRMPSSVVVHFVGPGATEIMSALEATAGNLAMSPTSRSIASVTAQNHRSIATTLQGLRLLLFNVDDSSTKNVSLALTKLGTTLSSITALPIVFSNNDRSPLILPDTWKILHVPVSLSATPTPVGQATSPSQWLSWMLNGIGKTDNNNIGTTTSSQLIDKSVFHLVESFASEWQPSQPSANSNKAARSTLSSVLPKLRALAAQKQLGSIPITQQSVAQSLEKLKFKVVNHSGKLSVEWHPITKLKQV